MSNRFRPAPLIGLGGLAASGKDTFAEYLHKHYGYAPPVGMSDPLIHAMRTLDPLIDVRDAPDELRAAVDAYWDALPGSVPLGYYRATTLLDALGYTDAKRIPAFRDWLRTFGTDVARSFDPAVWVNVAGRTVHALRTEVEPVLTSASGGSQARWGGVALTGIRYPNEAAAVRDAGGLLVYVSRAGLEQHGHTSENSVDASHFDIAVDNNGTLAQLYAQAGIVAQAARAMNGKR